jgi:large subunit ribosomal protein L10
MAKQLKNFIRKEITKRFKPVDGGVVVQYRGLGSAAMYDLRTKLHHKGAKFHIVKNSVATRAFQTLGYEESKLTKVIAGPVAIVYAPDAKTGMIGAAKAIYDFRSAPANKGLDKVINIKGGFFKGDILSEADVKALKDLPSREQLLAMVAGAFQAPIQGLANCFYQSISNFAGVIAALEDKKKKETK